MILSDAEILAGEQARARQAAAEYASAVRARLGPRVRWIRLFGSLARGDWLGPDESDVDVAVEVDRREFREEMELVDLATRVSLKHAIAINPKVFSTEEFARLRARELALAEDILAEGIVL